MPLADRIILEWLDYAAGFLRSGSWLLPAGLSGPLFAAMQAASNANLAIATRGVPAIGTVTPTDTLYGSVQDVAQFVFVTGALNQVPLVLPAPVASVFGAGGQTVDPTDPFAAAVIAAAIGNLSDVGGNAVTAFVSGAKSSRRKEQQ